jgi:hypothetical protein
MKLSNLISAEITAYLSQLIEGDGDVQMVFAECFALDPECSERMPSCCVQVAFVAVQLAEGEQD